MPAISPLLFPADPGEVSGEIATVATDPRLDDGELTLVLVSCRVVFDSAGTILLVSAARYISSLGCTESRL